MIAAVMLWRRAPWGYVLGSIMCVKGVTYALVLTASSAVSASRGIAGAAEQIPIWGVWTLIGLAAASLLLRGPAPARQVRSADA